MTTAEFNWRQFAVKHIRAHAGRVERDIRICLRQDPKSGKHAYFPALMTCISFLDFLSGLYAGNIKSHGYKDVRRYTSRFMDQTVYTDLNLSILYEGFRHKVAHLAHPYFLFDTSAKNSIPGPRKRIVFTVYARSRRPAITLETHVDEIHSYKLPWPVPYDHRIHISISSLKRDIMASLHGPNGYLAALRKDATLQTKFADCMRVMFSPK